MPSFPKLFSDKFVSFLERFCPQKIISITRPCVLSTKAGGTEEVLKLFKLKINRMQVERKSFALAYNLTALTVWWRRCWQYNWCIGRRYGTNIGLIRTEPWSKLQFV